MEDLQNNKNYSQWLKELKSRYQDAQIKASVFVNKELLQFYFELGNDIEEKSFANEYGSGFFNKLSRDLTSALPNRKGFSPRNLNYAHKFYLLYNAILQQPVAKFTLDDLFSIPWGHHQRIMDKCGKNAQKALFYVNKTIENNWSRNVLLNFLDTDLFERQGKAVSNFSNKLPIAQSDLAQQLTKDPYNFDFLTLQNNYDEKELKDALIQNIEKFLIELGKGFAFMGREYRLKVGDTEQFLDMLFYNTNIHSYVVIEVKTGLFNASSIGQLGTYVSAVNHLLKKENDNPTIGLLICKNKDNVLAKYALESSSQPLAISEYELQKLFPENFKTSMPTIEEIESELKGFDDNE